MSREPDRKLLAALAVLALATSACYGQTRPPQTVTPTVTPGKQSQVGFFYALDPDCSTRGQGDTRLIRKPEHGLAEIVQGSSFPGFPENSPLVHCNKVKVPGTLIMYKSEDGFAGKDHFDVEFIGPRGADLITRYVVTVK
jgi:hypothetical protein